MKRFHETILGQNVTIEVWKAPDLIVRYNGYTYCPMKECQSKDALKAEFRSTQDGAKSDAKKAITAHLKKVHRLR